MRKILLTTSFILCFWVMSTAVVHAAVVNKISDRRYLLQSDRVKVSESVTTSITDSQFYIPAGSEEVFIVFNPIVDDAKAEDKVARTIKTIQVKDAAGRSLKFTTEVDGQNILVKARYPSDIRSGGNQVLTISYDSYALSSQTGAIYDLYVPSFAEDFKFVTDTTSLVVKTLVQVPKKYGEFNFITPEVKPKSNGENWELKFTQEQLTGNVSWIQIGNKQFYQFEINQPYAATSNLPIFFNTYTVTLPRDVVAGPISQKVYFADITPRPSSITTDKNGNLLASFRLPANESGTITVTGYVEQMDSKGMDLTKSGAISDIKSEVLGENIADAKFWEVNSATIQKQARELQGTETDIYKLITKTYRYIVDKIDYSQVKRFGINERQGALQTLEGGAAVCMEYSDLFIALMRAQGVPARAAFGYGYDPRSTDGLDTAHQWAEVYLPAYDTWVMVDTTWGETGNSVIGGDLNHFYKYVASENPLTPAPVEARYFGDLDQIPSEGFKITAVGKPPAQAQSVTQGSLLESYPREVAVNAASQLWESVTLSASFVDTRLEDLLVKRLQLPESAAGVVKLVVYVLPICLLALTIAYRTRHHRRRRKSERESVKIQGEPRIKITQIEAT